MSERRAVSKPVGVLERLDALLRGNRGTAAIFLASLAMGGGAARLAGSLDAGVAQAKSPTARSSKAHKPKLVQKFVTVEASDAGGDPLGTQPNTFAFTEKCKAKGRTVMRKVVYGRPNQRLGKCDPNKPATVIERQPLQGEWAHKSGTRITHRRDNHFVFVEQKIGGSPPAPGPGPTPPPSPGNGDPFASGNVGTDISWVQCGTANERPSGFAFGIVDVSDGLGYSTNPCLASEAGNFPGNQLNLYVNTGWYSQSSHINPNSPNVCAAGDENCLAYNYGYNAGLYAVSAATGAGLDVATRWWLDVETINTWANDTTQNRNSLQGEYDALMASGAAEVGAYSTTAQWNGITGNWINNWKSWGATTWPTASEAQGYCTGHEFTGGTSELMQFTPTQNLDYDVAC